MRLKSFGKSANSLLFTFLINSIVDLFIYTFFTAHMLILTDNDICFIAQFYMIVYAMVAITFFAMAPLAKKLKHINVLRIGAVLKGLFILLVVILGTSIIKHYIWLAIIYGVIEGIFWSGGNTIKSLVVPSEKIKALISVVSINARLVGIICPVVFGVSIDAMSFNTLAIIILVFITMQIISTFFIKQITEMEGKSHFKQYFCELKNNPQTQFIKKSYLIIFFRGLQYFVPTFITYLIIYVLKTNTSLGILTTVASIVAIIILIIFNTIKKADTNIWIYLIFTVLEAVSLLLSIIFMMPIFIIIFQVVYTSTKSTVDSMSEALRGSTVRDAKLDQYMTESIAVGEMFLNVGRVIGFFALFILGLVNSLAITIAFGCLSVAFLGAYNIYTGIVKKQIKQDAELKEQQSAIQQQDDI